MSMSSLHSPHKKISSQSNKKNLLLWIILGVVYYLGFIWREPSRILNIPLCNIYGLTLIGEQFVKLNMEWKIHVISLILDWNLNPPLQIEVLQAVSVFKTCKIWTSKTCNTNQESYFKGLSESWSCYGILQARGTTRDHLNLRNWRCSETWQERRVHPFIRSKSLKNVRKRITGKVVSPSNTNQHGF